MFKKLVLMGGLAMALAFGLIAGGGTPTKANPFPGIQDFNTDMALCLVPGALTQENMVAHPAGTGGPYVETIDIDSTAGLSGVTLGTKVKVDNEQMTLTALTAGSPPTITVTRGIAGPTAPALPAHLQPKSVYQDAISPITVLGGMPLPPLSCNAGQGLAVGPSGGALATAANAPSGDRMGLPYIYNGPGPVIQADALIPDGTQVGDLISLIDLNQDGTIDVTADSTNCGGPPNNCPLPPNNLTFANAVGEQYIKQPITFGATTGCVGDDETYLNALLPSSLVMTPYVRYRACVDTVYVLGQYRVDIVALNGSPTPINLVTFSPTFSPAGTHVNLVVLSQIADKASPTTAILGLDTEQSSLSHTNAPYVSNATAPGLYAQWVTQISNADQANGAVNFVLSTSCKAIGGNYTDADNDCLATVVNPGSPGVSESIIECTGPTDPDGDTLVGDGDPDSDNDGLPDGIEVAWGSDPCKADTDGDSRSDTEEMLGPTILLSDPTDADTDDDLVPDGGLKLDGIDAGLTPDCPDVDGDDQCDDVQVTPPPPVRPAYMDWGWQLVDTAGGNGSSHVRIGYKIVGTDIKPDNVANGGNDNCPSAANAGQANFDLDSASTWGHGDNYGDACDSDKDNDGINNTSEVNFQYDQGAHQCSNDPNLPGAATPLNDLNPDFDGDGVVDGVECEVGSNPADAGDSPGAPGATDTPPAGDQDGVSAAYETFKRTQGFSGTASEDVDSDGLVGNLDPDSDNDGLSDGCEINVTGTNPMRADSDGNGTNDPSETNVAALAAARCTPNVADPVINMTITGAQGTLPRTTPGAAANEVDLQIAKSGGAANIISVSAGEVSGSAPTCPPTSGVLNAPGDPETWRVTWPGPACLAVGDVLRVIVGYNGVPPAPAPTWTLVTWRVANGNIGAEAGPGALAGVNARDVRFTFNIPVGTRLVLIAAGDGTSTCPWRLGWGPAWTVVWPTKCIATGQNIRLLMLYAGALPPTVASVIWSDPGLEFGPDPGPHGANVLSVATATDVDGDTVLNSSDNCPWAPNPDQANTDMKYGNGRGIAGDDSTVPWASLADKRGDACDGDLDNDGIPESTDANEAAAAPGVWPDITYDDNNDGTWKGATVDDGTLWDGNPVNAKLDGREAICPAGVPTTDTDGDGLTDRMEYCKWGSSPIKVDSDGNGKGDCNEATDTNGDGAANLTDVVNAAKAALLADAAFGKDGDFDINGDNQVNLNDVTQIAKFALIAGSCK